MGTRDPAEAERLYALEWTNSEIVFARALTQVSGAGELPARDAEVLAGRWFQQELTKLDASGRYEQWLAKGPVVAWERGDDYHEHEPWITLREALEDEGEELVADVEGPIRQALREHQLPLPTAGSAAHNALVEAFTRHWFKLSDVALARVNSDWSTPPTLAGEALTTEAVGSAKRVGRRLMEVFEDYAADRLLGEDSRGVRATLDEYRALMREFAELRADPPVKDITRAVAREYRALIKQLPTKGEGIRKLSATQKIAKAKAEGLPTISEGPFVTMPFTYLLVTFFDRRRPVWHGR